MLCRASSKRRWAICARLGGRSGEVAILPLWGGGRSLGGCGGVVEVSIWYYMYV